MHSYSGQQYNFLRVLAISLNPIIDYEQEISPELRYCCVGEIVSNIIYDSQSYICKRISLSHFINISVFFLQYSPFDSNIVDIVSPNVL